MKRIIGFFSLGLVLVVLMNSLGVFIKPVFGAVPGMDLKNFDNPSMIPEMADGMVVPSPEYSQTAQSAVLAIGGPVYYRTYGGFEFQPGDSILTLATTGVGLYVVNNSGGGLSFRRALELPNGAQVTGISMFVIDNSPTLNLTVQVTQSNPSVSVSQNFPVSLSTTNAVTSNNIQTVSISGSPLLTIDNSQNVYSVRYQPSLNGNTHILVGVRIEFTLPTTFIPVIMR